VSVTVGKGGRPGGRDGYVLVVTHLADEETGRRHEFTAGTDWTPPPEITPCPYVEEGIAAADDPAYDMCACGRRHITITAYGSGGSEP
jgi:hypothetical protein